MTNGKPGVSGGGRDAAARFPIQENEVAEDDFGAFKEEGWIIVPGPSHEKIDSPRHEASATAAGPPLKETKESSSPPRPHILAHSKRAQKLFDTIPLSWGVQYEIARGVTQGWWSWKTVVQSEPALRSLSGPNTNASRVSQVLGQSLGDFLQSDAAVWVELDREDAAIVEGRGRGLGLQGEFMGQQDWYGGKLKQTAVLQEAGDGFHLSLTKMEMGKSTRFARFLGSRRMLQIRIPRYVLDNRADELRAFFAQKFVLCGRVFVAFYVKRTEVFMMEVPEDYKRVGGVPGDDQRITLMDFIAWHSPMDRNGSQPLAEWVSNFNIGLSSSVPVLSFRPENVRQTSDLVATLNDADTKPSTKCINTDGCGYMNDAALSAIARHMGLEERPTVVQGRLGGAKGLWALHPRDQSSTPKIWIRESQVKIKLHVQNPHPAHNIFELLGLSRVTPSRLSRPVILNLTHNGVPKEAFIKLMKDTVNKEVTPLMQWAGPKAMALLAEAVESLRINREWMDYDLHNYSAEAVGPPRRTIHHIIIDLLEAGFHPEKLQFLFDSLSKAIRFGMDNIVHDFHFSVPCSARAFIVPDPYGVLREGEIHFKSTKPFNGVDKPDPCLLLGDVLIYRAPCVLPSDVQKVKAVQHDALSAYMDVVVVPTVGPRSFASRLGGGGYDGDVAVVVYDDTLVSDFRPPPMTLKPRTFVEDNFEEIGAVQQGTVNDLAVALDSLTHDSDARRRKAQKSFLSRLSRTAPIGLYHRFHEGSAYGYGYDAPETIRLAWMLKTLKDSQTMGCSVKDEIFKGDKVQFSRELPPSLQSRWDSGPHRRGFKIPSFKRDEKLGEFVLDHLLNAGLKIRNKKIKRFDRLEPTSFTDDEDLARPWTMIQPCLDNSSPVAATLTLIRKHVDTHIKKWQDITRHASGKSSPWAKDKAGAAKSAQMEYDELARSYAAGPEIPPDSLLASSVTVEQLKASYAYTKKPRFAWSVALHTLCQMKQDAQGERD